MRRYQVDVDFETKIIEVDASNKEEAEEKAIEIAQEEPARVVSTLIEELD